MSSVLRLSALTLLAACTGAARTSSLAHPTEKPAMGVSKACKDARRDRALAPALRADGRWIKAAELGLAVRAACPANQAEDEALVEELLALGALDEARAIAQRRPPTSTRMRTALDTVARLLRPATPTEVAEANNHLDRAELAEVKGESEARDAWLLARGLVHPNARALAGAARASTTLGQEVEARKLSGPRARGSRPADRRRAAARGRRGAPGQGLVRRLERERPARLRRGPRAQGARRSDLRVRRRSSRPTSRITQAAWAKDGRSLFVATDQHLRELDARTGELRRELPGRSQVSLSADGKVLAFLASDGVAVVDAASGARKWTSPTHRR